MNLAQYFAMGGYAAFIWPSYALAVLLLVGVFLLAQRRLNAAETALGRDENPAKDPEQ
ncbi:MAG TPA: heme exporter protein CcmD [Candidatus Binatia bacterium]|nr:heme exporter protein CcmD [Candidatus Binatia bacterium]